MFKAALAASATAHSAVNNKYRILIVDDNFDSAQTIAWTIEVLGHETAMAHDGPSAIAVARAYNPHVVLLDIGLGGKMNGFDVCETLRQEQNFKNTIFVAQTGWSEPEHIKRSKEAGFQHHLVKPLQIKELEEILTGLKAA